MTRDELRANQSARGAKGVPSALVTHCVNGHERTPENTYTRQPTGRERRRQCGVLVQCKVCIKARVYAARAAGYVRKDTAAYR